MATITEWAAFETRPSPAPQDEVFIMLYQKRRLP
jgi:hypothetical protein